MYRDGYRHGVLPPYQVPVLGYGGGHPCKGVWGMVVDILVRAECYATKVAYWHQHFPIKYFTS